MSKLEEIIRRTKITNIVCENTNNTVEYVSKCDV